MNPIKIDILQVNNYKVYDEFLLTQDDSLLYYSSKYKTLLQALLNCDSKYLLAIENSKICGILPLMYIQTEGKRLYNSLPFYRSNGGVISNGQEYFNSLVQAYNVIARDPNTLGSTIIQNPFSNHERVGIAHNFTDFRINQFTNLTHQGDPWNNFMASFDSSARRNIRKALKQGVSVEIDNKQLDLLRQLHQENIQAIGGIPKQDSFFNLIPTIFTPGQDYNIFIAKNDGEIIAALLLFYFNKTVEYFTPAIDNQFRTIHPMALIIINAMVDAAGRGFQRWNWGGTWFSQTGVYQFKKKWASLEIKYNYFIQLNDKSILSWPKDKIQ